MILNILYILSIKYLYLTYLRFFLLLERRPFLVPAAATDAGLSSAIAAVTLLLLASVILPYVSIFFNIIIVPLLVALGSVLTLLIVFLAKKSSTYSLIPPKTLTFLANRNY